MKLSIIKRQAKLRGRLVVLNGKIRLYLIDKPKTQLPQQVFVDLHSAQSYIEHAIAEINLSMDKLQQEEGK